MNPRIKKGKASISVRILIPIMVLLFVVFYYNLVEVDAAGTLAAPAFPKVARASASSLRLTWHEVSGAAGYEIFRYDTKAKKS